ncbi:MAG TPA: type II secretion system F family protein [Deltaproteobacteria bacterium]|jgi:type IV pilus assembly protein PilC|nr:type II secretion system F family protein [Deltaproteobacteria bacterium]HRW79278.1 type II secretion system F family protein [Desulfomonilia bacterium]NMD39699.1 type II secretion system F family protein [Deltaproteobacteria bacterium]HNQ84780.1 type II secretion system F family protein [Deltaproteobacteria bacterium]HNS89584.1 type II secretion system F family protein [Deltaproteobacteria bacterium]
MSVFVWEGRLPNGTTKKGEFEAADKAAASMILKRQRIVPTKLKVKPQEIALFSKGIKTKEIVIFTRQFSTMINAGLPLVQCLDILSSQQPNPTFKKVLAQIKQDVEGGSTFADALGKHPKVFDNLYVNLVAAGEIGGVLDTVLNRLAVYMEKNENLKNKVKSAMTYPIIVLCVAFGVVAVLMIFVIPTFSDMFKQFGSALPGPTQLVVSLSNFFRDFWWGIFGAIVAFIIAFKYIRKQPKGRYYTDKMFLRLPVFGPLLRKVAVAKFTRTLGTMISSGVPIMDGLDITSKTAGNVIVEEAIRSVRTSISEGKSMSEPLEQTGIFPGMVVQMIAVGEATGAMDQMLSKIADFYDEEVDTAVETLTSALEPILMVFLGGIIGFVVVAMYLPIFQMAQNV